MVVPQLVDDLYYNHVALQTLFSTALRAVCSLLQRAPRQLQLGKLLEDSAEQRAWSAPKPKIYATVTHLCFSIILIHAAESISILCDLDILHSKALDADII